MYKQNIVRGKVLLIIVFCLSISFVQATDDNSIGDFDAVAWDNDPFILLEWFTTDELITPLVNVEFSLTVYDEDNSSDELNVTLFYSNSEFYSNNLSELLIFDHENSPHNFTYVYTLAGQSQNTRIHYYYKVTDGLTVGRRPINTDEYYDVLWSELAITRIYSPDRTDGVVGDILDLAPYAIIPIFIMLIFFIIFLGRRKQNE